MRDLVTIGIGKRTVEEFFTALKANHLDVLVDIRSSPWSKFKPEFNRDNIDAAAKLNGVKYVHWGEELGGFPKDPYILTEGRVDYAKLAKRPDFINCLERVIDGLEKEHKIAIFCSEGRPEECHRSKCIGEELIKRQVGVQHIDVDGSLVDQQEVMARLNNNQIELIGIEKPHYSKRKWKGEYES